MIKGLKGLLGGRGNERNDQTDLISKRDVESMRGSYERLKELYRLSVDVYQNPDEALDRLVTQVAKIWEAPIAMINLVDEETVRFKTFVGLPPELAEKGCMEKKEVFCTHVVETDKPLVVSDARQDPRFAKLYIVQEVGVQSYLGVPLRNFQRKPYGTLCLVDIEPRFYQPDDIEFLSIFSMRATSEMERLLYIDRLMKMNRKMEALATLDGLTKVENHRHLHEEMATEFERSRRQGTPFTCMFLDLDDFKMINEFYGHAFGDLVLREVADILKKTVRVIDVIGRYGGDQFVISMPNTLSEQAANIAERARAAIHEHVFADGTNSVRATVSVGVASYPAPDMRSKEDLILAAKTEMKRAKEQGRDRVVTRRRAA